MKEKHKFLVYYNLMYLFFDILELNTDVYAGVADCTNSAKKDYKMCRFPRVSERRKIWAKNTGRQDFV